MCYVHNQWYDISCATLYFHNESLKSDTLPYNHHLHHYQVQVLVFVQFCFQNNQLT